MKIYALARVTTPDNYESNLLRVKENKDVTKQQMHGINAANNLINCRIPHQSHSYY